MTEKLVRNTTDERWRKFWEAVDAAAAQAPRLQFEERRARSDNGARKSSGKRTARPRDED